MPLLRAAPGRQRRRLRGRRLPTRSTRGSARWTTWRRWPPTCTQRGMACASTWCSTTPPREHAWAQAAAARRPERTARLLPGLPRPDDARRATSRRCPRSSPTPRPATSPTSTELRLGVDDVQHLPVGPRLVEPRRLRRDARHDALPGQPRGRRAAPGRRRRSCGSGWAPTARTSPRCTCCCRRCARWPGSPRRRRLQGRGDRRRPQELVPYLGAHDHVRPECDLAYHNQLMVLLWSSLATRDAPAGARARCAGCAPTPPTTAWVTYVRCHDDIGWAVSDEDAARRSAGPASRTAPFLSDFYAGDAPRVVRPRRGLPGTTRAPATAASPAARPRCAGSRPPASAATAARSTIARRRLLLLYRVVFAYGGIPLLYMGDELGAAQRPALGRRPRARRRQPVAAPAADGLGGGRPAHRPGHRRGPRVRRAGASWRESAAGSWRCGPAPSPSCGTPATSGCWPICGATHAGDG